MAILGVILGIVLGSFSKVLADRSLNNKSFWGRSYCPACKHKLTWYDLFPIFSYLFLKGKCRYCQKKIGIEYPVIEVVMGILVGLLFWQSSFNLTLILSTFFIVILVTLFLTDIKEMLIPDRIIVPSLIIGIFLKLISSIINSSYLPFVYAVLTGLGIGLFFYSLIIITRGKGMGGGDVKLGAFIGLMLGFPNGILAIFLAFFIGAIFSIGLIILRKKHFGQVIPFGPFLVIGSLLMLYWGQEIMNWYLYLGRI